MTARARVRRKSTEVFHVEHTMDNPRDNLKNPGLTYIELLMRSRDLTGKYRKKFKFSIFFYMEGLTYNIFQLFHEVADT